MDLFEGGDNIELTSYKGRIKFTRVRVSPWRPVLGHRDISCLLMPGL